ncbi:EAL domain-containing response regulator [Extibacter muris]|uniref:two-component system response regulator n=1 Tax=Extibacter muris TaxID=1796622 RepID=UPI001D0653D2|nr:EAL domain-containing response regulator [Extibacter muris]MCB6200471.1 EAL domain-containing protein [Extibacter muris]MCQ4663418.1 EAL domain-containing protein [Extibacter muris]MCQ4692842.1 EAL domain-containing protein [Extibacter muris]
MDEKKKILVVEDQAINRGLLCQILADTYEVLEAENGQAALEILKRHGGGISLILLDIIMPVMDGYTFLSILKKDAAYSAIPVIVTTQSDGDSNELAALSHGATDFVAKPYKPQIILHRVASLISLSSLQKTAAMVSLFQTDRLTGLYSKEYFYEKAKEVLAQNPDKRYDLICSDIENFKLINDIFGIPTADKLLCGIADLYRKHVDAHGVCCRVNADRFACLVEHRQDYVNEMFVDVLEKVNAISEVKNIVMKWGVYPVNSDGASMEQMYDRALLAAQSIKGTYGTCFAVYDDALRSQMLRTQRLKDGMESALAEKQFEIYLQPKYRIQDGALIGAEALVRWNHPEWGFQSPAEFIPLFEKNGFITKLDQYVWDMACGVLEKWDRDGFLPLPVSVNVSRADIHQADIAQRLLDTVRRHGLSPDRLHLEITESAYTESTGQIVETVEHLRELGFIIEMDDFGSGYSSLNMLSRMPVDVLKLDMKFLQSEMERPAQEGVMQFIITLARFLKLIVIAEGVETEEELNRLREIDCDCVQGYYFAKPMPVEAFEAMMKETFTNIR